MTEATSDPDPVYDRHGISVHHASALTALSRLPDSSVDAVITDPPYGLGDHKPAVVITALTAWVNGDREHVPDGKGFMGRDWDAFVPPPAIWDECLRVLKPGGHLAVFAGTRTVDLMGLSVRLAGFEIRDGLQWLYGSGMPKGLDVSKAIDKAANVEREVVGPGRDHWRRGAGSGHGASVTREGGNVPAGQMLTAPATEAALRWHGWSTSLKPACEPIVLARKPLGGSVTANVLAHGTGAMNIDACRTEHLSPADRDAGRVPMGQIVGSNNNRETAGRRGDIFDPAPGGRWPTNVLLAHHPGCGPDDDPQPCVVGCHVAELDQQSGVLTSGKMMPTRPTAARSVYGNDAAAGWTTMETNGDSGGASRFFPSFRWEAKASTSERPQVNGVAHPTVKPVALMRWLVRLLTPPGGLVLDPFAGSGTTGQAARAEAMRAVLIEREADYIPLIKARLDARERTPAASTGVVSGDEPMDLLDLLAGEAS